MTEKKPMRAELVDDYRIKCQLLLEEVIDAEEAAKLAAAEIAELRAERDRLKAALQPFARFAKMFAEAREHRRGHVPVEPNAEWYARETKQGTYILTPGMFDEALSALGDAS